MSRSALALLALVALLALCWFANSAFPSITAGIKIVCDQVPSLQPWGAWLGTEGTQRRRGRT